MSTHDAAPGGRPRIVHLGAGGTAVGGVAQHLLCVAPHLARHGFDVVLAFLGDGITPETARRRGLHTEVAPRRGRGDLLMIARLARLFRRLRPDVVHTHTLSTNFYGRVAARWAGVPHRVTTVHSFVRDLRAYDAGGQWGNRLLVWHNERANRSVDRLVAISQGIYDQLVAAGLPRERVRLIRCGIDVAPEGDPEADRRDARQQWGVQPEQWVIGNIGRAHPVKAQRLLLEAVAPLLRDDPAVRLVIVGDGPERERIRARAGELGVSARVVLPGAVPQARRLVAGFDVFALSSHMEGIPLALLEAMAAGRPVVSTDVGGVRELVCDGVSGLLAPPGSAEALREALLRLRAEPALATRLAAEGRRVVERTYDVANTSAELAALYREILGS